MYLIFKHAHMTLAFISIAGFMVRGILAIAQHPIMQRKLLRIAPHLIDTFLLGSALYLAWTLQANPLVHHWLLAKIIGLVAYIIFGAQVIKTRGSKIRQWAFYTLAVATFSYIIAVAITKSPSLGLW